MRLTEHVYLVGSGALGFDLTDPYDCHVYVVDGGSELALIDAGAGMGIPRILDVMKRDGLDPARLTHLLLTHPHADHAGGSARWRAQYGVAVAISKTTARILRNGDEEAVHLVRARHAGIYPTDYRFEACPVDRDLVEGDRIVVGDCVLETLDTPGHCAGHLSFLMKEGNQTILFGGDSVFFGGKIAIQNISDCIIDDYSATILKLDTLAVDALFPGHLGVSIHGGGHHIRTAADTVRNLLIPPSII